MPLTRLKKLNTTQCLWIYILRLLSEGPSHAYTLRGNIRERFGFKPGIMTAYKVLYLLERERLVTRKTEGRKKIYAITPAGRTALKGAVDFYSGLAKKLS